MAAKKTTLKHALPDGEKATRLTAREYTHVVVAREDLGAVRADKAKISRYDLEEYAMYSAQLAAGVGGTMQGSTWTIDAADVARAERLLAGCADAQAFAQKQADERVAVHDQKHQGAAYGPWRVLSWSGSRTLAEKAARGQTSLWRDVRVEAINHGQRELPAATDSLATAAVQGGALRNLDALQALLVRDDARALAGSSLRSDLSALASMASRPVASVMEDLRQFLASYDQRIAQAMRTLDARRREIAAKVYPDELPARR